MGDRFYEAQQRSGRAQARPKRKLKADWIVDIEKALDTKNLTGLLKTDLTTLENLYEAINAKDIQIHKS